MPMVTVIHIMSWISLSRIIHQMGKDIYIYYATNGNLVRQKGDKTVDYSCYKENHLVKATIRKGNSVTTESCTYDNEGMRKIHNNNYMDMEEMIVS